jgi:FlaA1/EpsC-like NDP-sugar epimerase
MPFIVLAVRVIDILLILLAFCLAYVVKKILLPGISSLSTGPNYYFIFLVALVLCVMSYEFYGLYRFERRLTTNELLVNILKSAAVGTAAAFDEAGSDLHLAGQRQKRC